MSNPILPINKYEYMGLYEYAVDLHKHNNDPIPKIGLKTIASINYILEVPFKSNFGKPAYVGFHKKASVLFYLMIKNHPLENGNKRLACLTLALFYQKNNRDFKISNSALYKLSTDVAEMNSLNMDKNLTQIVTILKKYE